MHMPRFVVIGQGTGYYWLAQRVCALGLPIIKQADAGELALVIVHEAAHARIYQAGVGWWPDLFERIERRGSKSKKPHEEAASVAPTFYYVVVKNVVNVF